MMNESYSCSWVTIPSNDTCVGHITHSCMTYFHDDDDDDDKRTVCVSFKTVHASVNDDDCDGISNMTVSYKVCRFPMNE
jgi:hypothetical protein